MHVNFVRIACLHCGRTVGRTVEAPSSNKVNMLKTALRVELMRVLKLRSSSAICTAHAVIQLAVPF